MAIYKNTPNIVTTGLILYIDPANQLCYTSGSSTCYSLSPTNWTGSVSSSVILIDNTFSFNGSTSCIDFNIFGLNFPFTFNVWLNRDTFGDADGRLTLFDNRATYTPNAGLIMSLENTLVTKGIRIQYSDGVTGYQFLSSAQSIPFINTWYYFSATINSGSATSSMYVNGILNATVGQLFPNNPSISGSQTYNRIGRPPPGPLSSGTTLDTFSGRMSLISFYNRILSPAEIMQNYNATKTRFGLS